MDPTVGTIAASDTAPVAELGKDFDSEPSLLIDPPDRILRARPDSYIGLVPLERCKARKRRFGVRPGLA
jgi:hypothetical protein